jgi:hypothetical protein
MSGSGAAKGSKTKDRNLRRFRKDFNRRRALRRGLVFSAQISLFGSDGRNRNRRSTPIDLFYLSSETIRRKDPDKFPLLLLGAIEVDALGNYFHLYGKPFGPVQYDEFAHTLCSALVTPAVIWILQSSAKRGGYRLPLGLITVIAVAMIFSLCGFYEIIELWDERYFHGKRIWGPYDTSNDLQQDLIGTLAGAALAYLVLRPKHSSAKQPDRLAL